MNWIHNGAIVIICFLLSRVLIDSGTHRELIRKIINKSDSSSKGLIISTLLLSYSLSLFFPNTIVVISLIPALIPLIENLPEKKQQKELSSNLGLAMIFGANTGGMGSMVGSPQNLLYLGFIELNRLPGRENITFFTWLLVGIPFTLLLLAVSYLIIKFRSDSDIPVILKKDNSEVDGRLFRAYIVFFFVNVLLMILLTAGAFFIKQDKAGSGFTVIDLIFIIYLLLFLLFSFLWPKGKFTIRRLYNNLLYFILFLLYSPVIVISSALRDAGEKLKFKNFAFSDRLDSLSLTMINRSLRTVNGSRLKSLSARNKFSYVSLNRMIIELPYAGLIFMGLVILVVVFLVTLGDNPATKEMDSYAVVLLGKLSILVAQNVSNVFLLFLVSTFASIFLTEFLNNTTVILAFFPVIMKIAIDMGLNPLIAVLTVLLGASAAFMSPVATSVNAVVFGGMPAFSVKKLLVRGFTLNILACIIISVSALFFL